MKTPALLWILCFALTGLFAEEERPAPPDPPFIAPAPAECGWTITLYAVSPADGTSTQGSQTTVYKSGNRRREVTVSKKGRPSEIYVVNGLAFKKTSGLAPGDVLVESVQSQGDFPEFSWVKAECFLRTQSDGGKKYHVYAWTPATMDSSPAGAARLTEPARDGVVKGKAHIEAWIDATTRLPARLVYPGLTRVYQFSKSSPQNVEPSEDIRRRVAACFEGQ